MTAPFSLGDRLVGPGQPVYVVAEISANHRGRLEEAERLVLAAKQSGADAVKLQTYTPDTMTIDCDRPEFIVRGGTPWDGRRLYDLYQEAHTPWEWQPRLKRLADEVGIALFSTPFDATAVDFLEQVGVPAYKIASFELVDLALVRRAAATGKPLVLSTGMATPGEIDEAVSAAREAGARAIALLHCVSAYPAPPEQMDLQAIPRLAQAYGVPVGLSDHTLGIAAAVAAVALGACLVEKHLTLSRAAPSLDSEFSLEPRELKALVDAVRTVERAICGESRSSTGPESASRRLRRSLFVVEDVRAGQALSARNVRSIRPGHGLAPRHLDAILGRRAAQDIARGTPLSWDLLSEPGASHHRE